MDLSRHGRLDVWILRSVEVENHRSLDPPELESLDSAEFGCLNIYQNLQRKLGFYEHWILGRLEHESFSTPLSLAFPDKSKFLNSLKSGRVDPWRIRSFLDTSAEEMVKKVDKEKGGRRNPGFRNDKANRSSEFSTVIREVLSDMVSVNNPVTSPFLIGWEGNFQQSILLQREFKANRWKRKF